MTLISILPVTRMRKRRLAAWLFGIVLCGGQPVSSAAQALSPTEQKIREYVRAHEAEQIAFLEKAVNISSGTFNLQGVRAVGRLFEPEFSSIGFDAKWIALPDAVGRAGHLFAERKGARGKRLLLIGHLDTVFEGEGERFVRLDTLAAGAGSSDMKGGDVVVLYALKALRSVGALNGTRIVVAFMGDEEDAGPLHLVSRQPLIDVAKRSDVALAFEEDAGKGTVARAGDSAVGSSKYALDRHIHLESSLRPPVTGRSTKRRASSTLFVNSSPRNSI